jgi:hypothetical protein
MLWLTACAIYLAASRTFLRRAPQTTAEHVRLWLLAAYTGTCWAGAAMAIASWRQRSRPSIEPGTWLLWAVGVILAAEVIVGGLPESLPVVKPSLLMATTCLATAWPTLSRHLAGHWKLLFTVLGVLESIRMVAVVLALTQDIDLLARLPMPYPRVRAIVALTVLGALLVHDQRTERQYSWLHWTGVACGIAWLLMAAV